MGYDLSGRIYLKNGTRKPLNIDRNYAFFDLIDSISGDAGILTNSEIKKLLKAFPKDDRSSIASYQEITLKTMNWIEEHIEEIEKIEYWYG